MYIPQLLANEIRAADAFHSAREVKRRTTYIKKQLDAMTEEQLTRFEFFVRSRLPRPAVKEIIAKALEKKRGPGTVVTDEMAIISASLAKLFVGDLIETAIEVMNEQKAAGIMPNHIEEAYRRMQLAGKQSFPSDIHCSLLGTPV
eukprot:gene23271-31599_t